MESESEGSERNASSVHDMIGGDWRVWIRVEMDLLTMDYQRPNTTN